MDRPTRNRWHAILCFLASLLISGTASARSAAGIETRAGAFDFTDQVRVGVERSLTLELRPGCEPTYDQLASDSLLAARGGLGSLGRAGTGKGVREVVGDAGDARRLFDQLRGANPVTEVKPGVVTAPGTNGGTVTFRATSKSGPPTVDVHGIEEGIRKIKFVDQ